MGAGDSLAGTTGAGAVALLCRAGYPHHRLNPFARVHPRRRRGLRVIPYGNIRL
ncbi:MAG: hypothetical protein MZV70_03415 [Desulfobacterales bacterium]|nr:hypothetical protein [Desulfobacterales bacterium]